MLSRSSSESAHQYYPAPKVIETSSESQLRFEDVFAVLQPRQQTWLAVRATTETDVEANEELAVSAPMASRWKSDPNFRFCYDRLARAGTNRERDLVAAIERSNAVRAAVERQRLLMTPWDQCDRSLAAAKSAMINDTLERVVPKRRTIEHRATASMKELVMDGHLEPLSIGEVDAEIGDTKDAVDEEGPEDPENDGV